MTTTGFSRKLRLLDQKSYNPVFANPDLRLATKHLLLLAKKNNLSHPRLGLAISKKRAPLATNRNLIKRHARETFRVHQHSIGGYDFIFLLRRNIHKITSKQIREEYLSIYQQFLAKQR